jgi:hypothetical protein
MAQIVKITVDDNTGEFDVDVTGYRGKGCDAIIQACGELGKIKTHIHKSEYAEKEKVTRTVTGNA